MKVKTSELKGTALDWVVAKCEEVAHESFMNAINYMAWRGRQSGDTDELDGAHHAYQYCSQWACGGPIIERERQTKNVLIAAGPNVCQVSMIQGARATTAYGSTPLIAAMRCYVASKLGDEVEIPEELL